MGKKKLSTNGNSLVQPALVETESVVPVRQKPLVFISHDSRDADLAEAFSNLLVAASGGILKSFRSSDKKGTAGIEFGAEWYRAIMDNLKDATDVIALLTPSSFDRPWILYEAGVARGKLDSDVFGVALGLPLERASIGPFAQFQNCGDDEDSLTKLVLQLIRRNPDATPSEEAVRMQVQAFRTKIGNLVKEKTKPTAPKVDENTVAKLFEEVKVMFKELPEQLDTTVRASVGRNGRKRRILHPGMIEELFMHPEIRKSPGGEAFSWLLVATTFRDDIPWFAELALDMHRALRVGDDDEVEATRQAMFEALEFSRRSPIFEEFMMRGSEDRDSYFVLRHLPDFLSRSLAERPKRRPRKAE